MMRMTHALLTGWGGAYLFHICRYAGVFGSREGDDSALLVAYVMVARGITVVLVSLNPCSAGERVDGCCTALRKSRRSSTLPSIIVTFLIGQVANLTLGRGFHTRSIHKEYEECSFHVLHNGYGSI